MRISFWHFLLLILLLAGVWYGYTRWWSHQSRSHWVGGLHNVALQSDEELKAGKDAETVVNDGPVTGDEKSTPPVKRDANGWITN